MPSPMPGFFYNLGKLAGPKVRKGRWVLSSLTGSELEAIDAEYEVGKDLAQEVRGQVEIDPSQAMVRWLGDLGGRLAECVKNKTRRFHFEAILEEQPNAFALPGGFIFISRALVELCEADPHEVGFVLAHEMAHVIRGHAIDRVISDSAIAAAARTTPVRGMLGGWLRGVGMNFVRSAYSQSREFEADALGARLAHAADFDVRAAMRLLRRLELLRSDAPELPLAEYFASHPPPAERIERLERLIGSG